MFRFQVQSVVFPNSHSTSRASSPPISPPTCGFLSLSYTAASYFIQRYAIFPNPGLFPEKSFPNFPAGRNYPAHKPIDCPPIVGTHPGASSGVLMEKRRIHRYIPWKNGKIRLYSQCKNGMHCAVFNNNRITNNES